MGRRFQASKDLKVSLALFLALGAVASGGAIQLSAESQKLDARRDMTRVRRGFLEYRSDVGHWPPLYAGLTRHFLTVQDLSCLVVNEVGIRQWKGPYLPVQDWARAADGEASGVLPVGMDSWGEPYQLVYFERGGPMGRGGGIVVHSFGPNRQRDTSLRGLSHGWARGDDLVLVITRHLDLPVLSDVD